VRTGLSLIVYQHYVSWSVFLCSTSVIWKAMLSKLIRFPKEYSLESIYLLFLLLSSSSLVRCLIMKVVKWGQVSHIVYQDYLSVSVGFSVIWKNKFPCCSDFPLLLVVLSKLTSSSSSSSSYRRCRYQSMFFSCHQYNGNKGSQIDLISHFKVSSNSTLNINVLVIISSSSSSVF